MVLKHSQGHCNDLKITMFLLYINFACVFCNLAKLALSSLGLKPSLNIIISH